MKMENKVYDVLKWIALIFFPAVSALYSGLAALWGFPYSEQITGSIGLVGVFLGAILQISNSQYKKNNL